MRRRSVRAKVVLTEAQLHFLRTGDHGGDADLYLDWCGGRDQGEVREAFESIRGDFPENYFEWAEREFGGRR